jgi:hypothetical protein
LLVFVSSLDELRRQLDEADEALARLRGRPHLPAPHCEPDVRAAAELERALADIESTARTARRRAGSLVDRVLEKGRS